MRQDLTESEALAQWMAVNESVLGHLSPEQRKAHHDLERAMGESRRRRKRQVWARRVIWVLLTLLAIFVVMLSSSSGSAKAASASCYGPGLFGNSMANGERLHTSTIAIAHKTLPFGTRLAVRSGGVTVKARVKDRGPFVADRSLDLTYALVLELGYGSCTDFGVRSVRTWRS
jgi:rare lipoprotein A (peptidoglycan hydrolase)